jgi:RNA polymerase sigma-70 factor (ECF subfamily)
VSSPARLFPSIFPKRVGATSDVATSIRDLTGEIDGTTPETDYEDEALLRRLQEHHIDALGFLYRRYARIVYSICARILRNPTEAEDAVHEIFLCMFRKCRSFDPRKGKARPWIIRLAYSQCYDWRDKLISRDRLIDPEADESACTSLFRKNDTDPAYTILWNPRMLEAFNSLSKEQQQALMQFYFQGLTFQEIADEQGYSYGNAKHHVYRGLDRLRSIVFDRVGQKPNSGAATEMKCDHRKWKNDSDASE